MLQRILVPLDGSRCAAEALPVAAQLARVGGGSIILVRVVSTNNDFWNTFNITSAPTFIQTVVNADIAEAEQYLSEMTTSPLLDGIASETVVLCGPITPTIVSVARTYHTDLIVMTSHGNTGIQRWPIGRVAENIARHAPVPVLILREGVSFPIRFHPDMEHSPRVQVALDGSERALAALEPAAFLIAALAGPAQGTLHLMRVIKSGSDEPEDGAHFHGDLHDSVWCKAERYLRSTTEDIQAGHIAPAIASLKVAITWSIAIDTDIAGALVRAAQQQEGAERTTAFDKCSMIAMATHGHGGLVRWAMGSITERVLATTTLPLLVVRPTDTTTGEALKTLAAPCKSVGAASVFNAPYEEQQRVVIAS